MVELVYRRKTLVEVDLSVWAKVKHFATIEKISVNEALEVLLSKALNKYGYRIGKDVPANTAKTLASSGRQIVRELSR